jgi:hypothetical protein
MRRSRHFTGVRRGVHVAMGRHVACVGASGFGDARLHATEIFDRNKPGIEYS